jgi:4-hydroxy-tetrahydrodipicolinate synthase
MIDKTAYPLAGVVPIIHTPWTEDDQIDFPSLERLIEQSIADGISGCIMPAVASEVSKLSDDERTSFVEEVVRMVDGRIQVTAGVSDPDVRRCLRLAEHAVTVGVDGVLCAVPMDIIEDKPRVKAFMHELAKVDLPMLMIQDLHWNGYGMALDTIAELWEEIKAFRCLNLETVPAGYKMT